VYFYSFEPTLTGNFSANVYVNFYFGVFMCLFLVLFSLVLFSPVSAQQSELTFTFSPQHDSPGMLGIYTGEMGNKALYARDGLLFLALPADDVNLTIQRVEMNDWQVAPGDFPDSLHWQNAANFTTAETKRYRGKMYLPLYVYPIRRGGDGQIQVAHEVIVVLQRGAKSKSAGTRRGQAIFNGQQAADYRGNWLRFAINENRVYRIRRSDLANWDVSADNPEDVHIFSYNGAMLPLRTDANWPQFLPELPLFISNHTPGNGWQDDEEIFVYARGVEFFHHDSVSSGFSYHHHYYASANYLWLRVDGSYASPLISPGNVASAAQTDHVMVYEHLEKDEVNRLASGNIWYENARSRNNSPQLIDLPLRSDGICYSCDEPRLSLTLALAGGNRYLYYDTNGFRHYFDVTLLAAELPIKLIDNFNFTNASTKLITATHTLSEGAGPYKLQIDYEPVPFSASTSPDVGKYFYDYTEYNYPLRIDATPLQMLFHLDYGSDGISYAPDFSGADVQLWNVTYANSPKVADFSGDQGAGYRPEFTPLRKNSLLFVRLSEAPLLGSPVPVTITRDVFNPLDMGDLLLITPAAFLAEAQAYAAAREAWGGESISVDVVTLEDIYFAFSSGVKDPGAIRNFIRYAFTRRQAAPRWVLLAGDGNYDPKGIVYSGGQADLLPAFQVNGDTELSSFTCDFYYADINFTEDNLSEIEAEVPLGRLPVSSRQQFANYTEKLEHYGLLNTSNGWEHDFLLIADDLRAGERRSEYFHFIGAEDIFSFIPRRINTKKIYLENYPAVSGGLGRVKPAATAEFLDRVNQGQGVVLYIGHGSPDQWADETLYDLQLHGKQIANRFKNGLWLALSCDISKFDDPGRATMGEDLINRSQSGAMWVAASTRLVAAFANNELGERIVKRLYDKDQFYTVGEAFTLAVQEYNVPNTLRYVFFGDPSLPSLEGRNLLAVDNLRNRDTLKALDRVEIQGSVPVQMGSNFNGFAVLRAYDAEDDLSHPDRLGGVTSYRALGPNLYRGQMNVVNSRFNAVFIVPKSIKYSAMARGKIWVYAWDPATYERGHFVLDSIVFNGSAADSKDANGPAIDLSINGQVPGVDGDMVPGDAQLSVVLADSSGINLSGEAGHGISLWVDDAEQLVLNDFFVYDANSATQGRLLYTLSALEPGLRSLRLQVWDNANNPSEIEFTLDIVESGTVSLDKVYNYPNPMRDETWFTCQTPVSNGRIIVDIFSVSGRKLNTVEEQIMRPGFQKIYWDGRDSRGNRLAIGTYLYRLTLESGGEKRKKTEKLVILR
jgi:hypothetical protein